MNFYYQNSLTIIFLPQFIDYQSCLLIFIIIFIHNPSKKTPSKVLSFFISFHFFMFLIKTPFNFANFLSWGNILKLVYYFSKYLKEVFFTQYQTQDWPKSCRIFFNLNNFFLFFSFTSSICSFNNSLLRNNL